jgi:hypothetical protein
MTTHPILCFFPALPLDRTLEFGEWRLGTPPADVVWRPDPFKRLAQALLASFENARYRDGAVLYHRDRGIDGTAPEVPSLRALYAAVAFAAADSNANLVNDPNAGHSFLTTENAHLFVQPVDEQGGWITHVGHGLLRQVLSGGWKLGEQAPPLPGVTDPIHRPRPVSAHLARALYEYLLAGSTDATRVATALDWHRSAMMNSEAVTVAQRFIALKTAFEVITGTDQSVDSARQLRGIFEAATASHRALLPWAGLLWSPKERTDVLRTYTTKKGTTKTDRIPEIEHWFLAFADARNEIIHEGRVGATEYKAPPERPLSRYAGSFFGVAERVLRETIKAKLGADVLLCGRLAEEAAWKPLADYYRSVVAATKDDEAVKEPAVEASRTLSELLSELHAPAANTVQIGYGYVEPDYDDTDEDGVVSLVSRGGWNAKASGPKINVTHAERAVLLAAGAEEELSTFVHPCE